MTAASCFGAYFHLIGAPSLRQVERVDDVRKRRVDVHRAADDERLAFVSAEDAGRERPRDLQVLDVLGVDFAQPRCSGSTT